MSQSDTAATSTQKIEKKRIPLSDSPPSRGRVREGSAGYALPTFDPEVAVSLLSNLAFACQLDQMGFDGKFRDVL